jgi:hypothetical protein
VADPPEGRTGLMTLAQNSPNPFQGQTRIAFRVEQGGRVLLRLYDLRGRVVRTLVNDDLQAGDHEVTVDGTGLASGVYLFRLEARGEQVRRPCIILN